MNNKNIADSMINNLEKICEMACVILLFVVVGSALLQVFFRFVIRSSLLWSEELSRYAGIWLVMLSTSIAILKRSHMAIDILSSHFPPILQRITHAFSDLVIVFVSVYMMYAVNLMIQKFFSTPSPAMRIPMGIIYYGVIFSWGCCTVAAVYNAVKSVRCIWKPSLIEGGEEK